MWNHYLIYCRVINNLGVRRKNPRLFWLCGICHTNEGTTQTHFHLTLLCDISENFFAPLFTHKRWNIILGRHREAAGTALPFCLSVKYIISGFSWCLLELTAVLTCFFSINCASAHFQIWCWYFWVGLCQDLVLSLCRCVVLLLWNVDLL